MSMLDSYRNNAKSKRGEIAKLYDEKSKLSDKISKENKKIVSAKDSIKRTKSLSTIKSKNNDITKAEKAISDLNKKISSIERKIAKAENDLADIQKKIDREEKNLHDKKIREEKAEQKRTEEKIRKLNKAVESHERQQAKLIDQVQALSSIPEHITVLFLAANPVDTPSLRLDAEAREIQEMIRKSKYRDTISFVTRWAVRTADILQAINEVNPDIIHFSGHGTSNGELAFENSNGECKLVSKEAMAQTIGTLTDQVKFMFFNACFSAAQAEKVVEVVDAAIGMSESIGDEAAKIFAAQFYSSVGFGYDIQTAFNQAKAALMLEGIPEEQTPELFVNPGVDSSQIVLVASGEEDRFRY